MRNVGLILVSSLRHNYYPQIKWLLELSVFQYLTVINNSGLSLLRRVQPALFN